MSNRSASIAGLLAIAIVLFAGCGGGGETGTQASGSARAANPATCRAGRSILPLVPEAPGFWTDGPGPTLALACLDDRFGSGAIVGFASPDGPSCVAAYDFQSREESGQLCMEPGVSWMLQCEGDLGCVHSYFYEGKSTHISGRLDPRVRSIKVLVDGKPVRAGVMVGQIEGKVARSIQAERPIGFFAIYIPGCVSPPEVKIALFGANGSSLGLAHPWVVHVPGCPHKRRANAPPA